MVGFSFYNNRNFYIVLLVDLNKKSLKKLIFVL